MAVPAKKLPPRDSLGKFDNSITIPGEDRKQIAAQLYGLGFKRSQIAQYMVHVLSPSKDLKSARRILLKWEQEKDFRDLIYQFAVVKMDMETPHVLKGITRAAKRGRVDAAKLVLGITERYTDKSEMPTEVTIKLAEVVRPTDRAAIRPGSEREIEGPK